MNRSSIALRRLAALVLVALITGTIAARADSGGRATTPPAPPALPAPPMVALAAASPPPTVPARIHPSRSGAR